MGGCLPGPGGLSFSGGFVSKGGQSGEDWFDPADETGMNHRWFCSRCEFEGVVFWH